MTRCTAVKKEFADIENLRIKLENKDEDVKELKKSLKMKVLFDLAKYLFVLTCIEHLLIQY